MKHLLVLGAGSAGTMVANKLRPRLPSSEWRITLVDKDDEHHYQPGYLFIPFGAYRRDDVVRPRARFLPSGVDLLLGETYAIDPEASSVTLEDGTELPYDQLVIATGTQPRPDQTPGMLGPEWRDSVHEFYTLEGAEALAEALTGFQAGRFVVHVAEMPIKCPVAPLELLFLADAHFREAGVRDQVELVYVTPLDAAFTTPVAAQRLAGMLSSRGITVQTDFVVERIDDAAKTLISYDEREIPFDLLVTVPVNMGADAVGRSGLGDELNHVPVDPGTLQSRRWPNVFALGDAAALPIAKAGSGVHFSVDVFAENFVEHAAGRPMPHAYDGHVSCFVESGNGKALLLDYNYATQPLPGRYPLPGVGPFALLEETAMNHAGKMMFKWTYWHLLLRGREVPLAPEMTLAGKVRETAETREPQEASR
ncbi:MAG: FAD/NAD(P)-binding oxidoreductase [Trueperaceae bacterium]|nr:FAD/NAD(P)-binding oxidoreductase [Trueperaceae bacterium]